MGDGPIKFDYTGAHLTKNNPIECLIRECSDIFMSTTPGCIVSLGTGKLKTDSLKTYKRGNNDAKEKLYNGLLTIAEDSEKKHQAFAENLPEDKKDIYFRLNVELGLEEVTESDWNQAEHILAQTYSYVTPLFSLSDPAIFLSRGLS